MLGAILGDIIGSTYEFNNTKDYHFKLFTKDSDFTDDTVLTVAVADAVLRGVDYGESIRTWALKYPYPKGAYGGSFQRWMYSKNPEPYGSFGNGSAMRVSAIGWLFDSEKEVLDEARKSAECTHNHPEGIKGAQATAMAVFFARNGKDKNFIREYMTLQFGYDLNKTVAEIHKTYTFDVTCQGTLPESLTCFLESTSFEDAIRKAIYIGGDSDTVGAIVGAIAEAYYGIPEEFTKRIYPFLPKDMLQVISMFQAKTNPSTEIGLSQETKKLREKYAQLQNRFSELFMEKQNMLEHEKPLLTSLYLHKIGQKKYEEFCLTIELQKLKLKFSLLQACVNRNELPNTIEIENEVETRFFEYNQSIKNEAERLAAARDFLSGSFLSKEDTAKLKELYRLIVKRLHPDLNPNLTDEMKDLFIQAKTAYDLSDLSVLQQIALLLDVDNPNKTIIDSFHLEDIIRKLEENINTLENQISALENEFPFLFKEKIYDDEWVKQELEITDNEIEKLETEINKYKEYILLLEEWKPE